MAVTNLPAKFFEHIMPLLGEDFDQFIDSYKCRALRGVRIFKHKETEAFYHLKIGACIKWEPRGSYLEDKMGSNALLFHHIGCFYLQEPSAMAPVAILDPQPGETVLDLCAAPGSKSTQIAQRMDQKGLLIANEPNSKRAFILSENIQRMGIPNCVVTHAMPEYLAALWPELFDAILVDAPCSGEGMFRRNLENALMWSENTIYGCAKRQRKIISEAVKMLKPGGRLCYSTCTFNEIENEQCCKWFLDTHTEMTIKEFSLNGVGNSKDGMIRLWPHRVSGEGQFAALFVKKMRKPVRNSRDSGLSRVPEHIKRQINYKDYSEWQYFFFGDTIVAIPETFPLKKVPLQRVGIHIGKFSKGYFSPDHAIAVINDVSPDIMLGADDIYRYLQGEDLTGTQTGWLRVGFHDISAGWVKGIHGMYKNHYPKNLRAVLAKQAAGTMW